MNDALDVPAVWLCAAQRAASYHSMVPWVTVTNTGPGWACQPLVPCGWTVSRSAPTSVSSSVLRDRPHLPVLSPGVLTWSVPKWPLTIGDGAKPDPGVAAAGAATSASAAAAALEVMDRMRFMVPSPVFSRTGAPAADAQSRKATLCAPIPQPGTGPKLGVRSG